DVFFQAEDGIRAFHVTGVQTCALPISAPLALYVRLVCEAAWDLTWDHGPLLHLLAVAERTWSRTVTALGDEERLAVGVMLALRGELGLESACSTGDLEVVVAHARGLADVLSGLAVDAAALEEPEVAAHLASLIE